MVKQDLGAEVFTAVGSIFGFNKITTAYNTPSDFWQV
jgi:hypothetical protein